MTATSSKSTIAVAVSLAAVALFLLLFVGMDHRSTCGSTLSGTRSVAGDTGQTVAGLSEAQLRLARDGVVIGKQRRMPESAIIAELAAQATESSFRNLANPAVPESMSHANDGLGHNHDSLGPHQLRASVWGSVGIATLMDPTYQISWFYDHVEQLGAAATRMAPADLAQAVERSAPNAYATHLELARRLYAMFADIDPRTARTSPDQASGCGSVSGTGVGAVQASGFGRAVIEAGARWIGTPYVWGGGDVDGPTGGGMDCSGLTLYAVYHASGGRIRLPHYTQAQQDHPSARVVAFEQRQPGDLIFFTSTGEVDSHHVGIYVGRDEQGRDQLLHAPQTGQTVTIAPLSGFAGERMDVRRYSAVTDVGSDG